MCLEIANGERKIGEHQKTANLTSKYFEIHLNAELGNKFLTFFLTIKEMPIIVWR